MPTNRDEIKAICAMPMTGTAKLVAIAIVTFKTLDTNELAAITGESARTVQKARATYLELKDEQGETRESGEPEFAKDAKDANYNSRPSRAYKESPSEILTSKEDSHPLPPQSFEPAREGEEALAHGVLVNCKTIRHPKFAISVDSVVMGTLAAGWSPEQVKQFCVANALQWALEIENGQPARDVVPQKVINFLQASIMKAKNRGDCADAVLDKLKKPEKPKFGAASAAPTNYHEQERVIADRTKQLLAQALAGSRL